MTTNATIKRLRSKIQSHALSPDEIVEALLILAHRYKDQLEDEQSAPRKQDLSE